MNMKSHFGLRSHEQFSKMMPHGCIISCLLFNNFLTVEGQEIIFTRSLFNYSSSTYLSRVSKGVFLVILVDWLGNTISVLEIEDIRYEGTQRSFFGKCKMCELADSYRPGPWVRCLWKALSWAWPSGVSDVWGKFGLLLPGHLLSDNTDQRYKWKIEITFPSSQTIHVHVPSFLPCCK